MTYKETLDYMFSQLPMYQRKGKSAFKKDLTNILAMCEALGNPHTKFKSIHIAGTNGKGTTAHIIAAGLQANGLRVGMYTSPHYIDFRERIKINGQFISKEQVVSFVEQHKNLIETINPSFFEITVAMAFQHFATENVDIAIIETGLGGRLDSTNIIHPIISVITNISFDHQSMLGNTIEEIATEKAGIIKQNTPVIIGETQEGVDRVFSAKANERNATISFVQSTSPSSYIDGSFSLNLQRESYVIDDLPKGLSSSYQRKNLATGLYTLDALSKYFSLSHDLIIAGIKNIAATYYIGRWQELQNAPKVIADSAHNVAGVTSFLENIVSLTFDKLHIVLGMVNDKDIDTVLSLLPQDATYYFCKANIPRGLDSSILAEKANDKNLYGKHFTSVKEAHDTAVKNANKDDVVLIMGSVFVVAEVLTLYLDA